MNIESIEIHTGKGDFTYRPIRRLQAKVEAVSNFAAAPTINDGNAKLRELASKVGANAVVDVEYKTGASMTSWRSMTITGLAVERLSDERPCPVCAEMIKRAAIKCRYCGAEVEPEPTRDVAQATEDVAAEPLYGTNSSIVPYVIGTVIVGVMLLIVLIGNS